MTEKGKRKLILASSNAHKVDEIRHILNLPGLEILSLKDIGFGDDIPETGTTLEDNALIKARYIYSRYKCDVFADDTGLEVEALDGAPGVYSARYAGAHKSAQDNMAVLLKNMEDHTNRRARFRAVIALIWEGQEHFFEGIVDGRIADQKMGEGGFGYDPLFIPEGYDRTFGELPASVKNRISHRYRSVKAMAQWLAHHWAGAGQ